MDFKSNKIFPKPPRSIFKYKKASQIAYNKIYFQRFISLPFCEFCPGLHHHHLLGLSLPPFLLCTQRCGKVMLLRNTFQI